MIELQVRTKGVMRLCQLGKSQRDPILTRLAAECVAIALYKWATGKLKAKLKDRVGPNGFALYGFTPRSSGYRKRQRRRLGVVRPYFSPRGIDISRVVIAAAKGNAAGVLMALNQLSRTGMHMADMITRPGVGFMIRRNTASRSPRIQITLPGARVLNRNPKSAIYQRELLDMGLGNGRDARAIIDEAEQQWTYALSRINPPPARLIR